MSDYPLSEAEFRDIYSKVPRLTVEILLQNDQKQVFLSKRAIEPCLGQWHLPGGTVRFGEPMVEAVGRILQRELGATLLSASQVGYIEYPSHYQSNLDSPVGIVFKIDEYQGELIVNKEASEAAWFSSIPENMHADMDTWLIHNGYLPQAP